ncbi:unnamed protein product [Didymodactylos carnosus]|nr:unnamed protein product [Didymodactylos carnosus]CAF4287658.1 unnamed protein product [Didymodactylos carnosus]
MRDAAYDTILQLWNTYLENESTREDNKDDNNAKNSTLKAPSCTCHGLNTNKRENTLINPNSDKGDGDSLPVFQERLVDDVIQRCIDHEEKTKQAEQDKLLIKTEHQERQPSVTSKSSDEKQQQKKHRKSKDMATNLKIHTDATHTDQLISKAPAEHICGRHPDVRQHHSRSRYKQKTADHKTDSKKHLQPPNHIRRPHRTRSASSHHHLLDTNVSNSRTIQNRSVTPEPMTHVENDNTTTTTITNNDSLMTPSLSSNSLPTTVATSENSMLKTMLKQFLLVLSRLKFHSFSTSLTFLVFIILLFFHSIYLIKLAYRIENRLNALQYLWPTSSPTTVKNSVPTSAQMNHKDI